MTSGEDMSVALAKALVDGLEGEGVEQIWKSINEANKKPVREQEPTESLTTNNDEQDQKTCEKSIQRTAMEGVQDEDKVVFVDFVTFLGRRRKIERKAMKIEELDQAMESSKVVAQLSLFG